MQMQAKRKTGGLRLKKRASESHPEEDGQLGSSKGPSSLGDCKPMARMSDHTRMQLYSLLLQPQLSCSLPPLPPSKLVKYTDEDSVSPECLQELQSNKLVWTSLPPPNIQLLTKKPPKFLTMEELCCGTTADLMKSGPQYKIVDSGTEQGGLDTHSPLPPAQKAAPTGATTGASLAGSSGEEPGGYGSDLDLFEDDEFDRLCQDVELVCEGSSSDSSLPVVDLTPRVVEQPCQNRAVKQPLQARLIEQPPVVKQPLQVRVVERPHRTAKSKSKSTTHFRTEITSESTVTRCSPVHHGQGKARVLTPETCPMCSMEFPTRFTEVDVEQHIAACLAGDLRDFEEDDVIILD